MPLNKYLAHAGVCSRRNAVQLITQGLVRVNQAVVTTPGHRIAATDQVMVKNRRVAPERKKYILLNKPTECVTTVADEKGRRTVMHLVTHAAKERIYPVGRLDRMTTGLLLMTNDGDLAQRLAHPSNKIRKYYHVTLHAPLTHEHYLRIKKGLRLKDGFVKVDKISYLAGKRKNHVKVELHSGKKHIVRRIFEQLGYGVVRLDRFNYAGFTKRGLPLGRWRMLKKEEVETL